MERHPFLWYLKHLSNDISILQKNDLALKYKLD